MKLRFGLGGVVALVLLMVLPGVTVAAPNRVQHVRVSDAFTDANFCGTDASVDVKVNTILDFYGRNGRIRRGVGWERIVFTNPANGEKVVLKSSGDLDLRRRTTEDGKVLVASLRGSPAIIKTGEGAENRYRSLEPGYVVYVLRFSAQRELERTEVVMRDLDPSKNRAFRRLCRIASDALGL